MHPPPPNLNPYAPWNLDGTPKHNYDSLHVSLRHSIIEISKKNSDFRFQKKFRFQISDFRFRRHKKIPDFKN